MSNELSHCKDCGQVAHELDRNDPWMAKMDGWQWLEAADAEAGWRCHDCVLDWIMRRGIIRRH
jgi:hypothetical protein